jgi:hypothetical protein
MAEGRNQNKMLFRRAWPRDSSATEPSDKQKADERDQPTLPPNLANLMIKHKRVNWDESAISNQCFRESWPTT